MKVEPDAVRQAYEAGRQGVPWNTLLEDLREAASPGAKSMFAIELNPTPPSATMDPVMVIHARCYDCQHLTAFPAGQVTDTLLKYWEDKYARLLASLNEAIKECQRTFGDDPMRQAFEREMLRIRKEFEK